jgi:hypothetical protein
MSKQTKREAFERGLEKANENPRHKLVSCHSWSPDVAVWPSLAAANLIYYPNSFEKSSQWSVISGQSTRSTAALKNAASRIKSLTAKTRRA